jgi:hypothetical protein
VHPDDVGVPELGHDAGFCPKALLESLFFVGCRREYLQGMPGFQKFVFPQIDLSHGSGSEKFEDAVFSEFLKLLGSPWMRHVCFLPFKGSKAYSKNHKEIFAIYGNSRSSYHSRRERLFSFDQYKSDVVSAVCLEKVLL